MAYEHYWEESLEDLALWFGHNAQPGSPAAGVADAVLRARLTIMTVEAQRAATEAQVAASAAARDAARAASNTARATWALTAVTALLAVLTVAVALAT